MNHDDFISIESSLERKIRQRQKRRRGLMKVSGKSVFTLKRTIQKKAGEAKKQRSALRRKILD